MSEVNNSSISIALCTYNGMPFLRDQLLSIARQTVKPCELIVADDSSTDHTISLVKSFAKKALFRVRITENKYRLGVLRNYSNALFLCAGNYVALCDQDDIWLPEKLEISMQRMQSAERLYGFKTPLLTHTDLRVIDSSGKVEAPSFMKLRRLRPRNDESLPKLLAQNFVTGCTVMMNRSLIEAALPIPESAMMHDWWLALVAAATGKIIYIDRPTVLYRQHESNVIGAGSFFTIESLKKLSDIKARERELAASMKQAIALKDHLDQRTDHQVPALLLDFLNGVTLGGLKAIKTVNRCSVGKHGLIRNTVYKLLLLKGGYLKHLK